MPLELVIHKKIILSDIWLSKGDWEDSFKEKGDFLDLAELLNEDLYEFIEADGGGLFSMIKSARWIE